jgi:acetyl-CoA carboxylase biotin carboxyl carrier protein
MDFDDITKILELMERHELSELEVEHEGLRLRARKELSGAGVHLPATAPLPASSAAPAQAGTGPVPAVGGETEDVELAVVKSPIVGTFYRSSEPGAAPFVDIGTRVKKGDVLCIIEAMKLMNEIDSEFDGEIATVYVENGQPVQYGERLFAIRTV